MIAEFTYEDLKKAVRKVLHEQWEKNNSVEVIVTYDCIESDFRNKLRDELLINKYKAVRLSESTYWLPTKLSPQQLESFANEIIDLFEEVINESKKALINSIVRLIVPEGKEFRKVDIDFKK